MSATRTFDPYVGSGTAGTVAVGDPWTHVEGEALRQNVDALAYIGGIYPLGGDSVTGISSASYVPVNSYLSHTLNGDSLGGMTIDAVVYYKTANAATSVTVRLRNTTDSSNAATGTLSTSTTVVEEVLTVTLASGAKAYRLEVTGSDALNAVYAWGYLRVRVTPT